MKGVWVAWWPEGQEDPPGMQHHLEDESMAWTAGVFQSSCRLPMGPIGTLFIGGVANKVTTAKCLTCQAILDGDELWIPQVIGD